MCLRVFFGKQVRECWHVSDQCDVVSRGDLGEREALRGRFDGTQWQQFVREREMQLLDWIRRVVLRSHGDHHRSHAGMHGMPPLIDWLIDWLIDFSHPLADVIFGWPRKKWKRKKISGCWAMKPHQLGGGGGGRSLNGERVRCFAVFHSTVVFVLALFILCWKIMPTRSISIRLSCWSRRIFTTRFPFMSQIGWATKGSKFMNHDGFGVGDGTLHFLPVTCVFLVQSVPRVFLFFICWLIPCFVCFVQTSSPSRMTGKCTGRDNALVPL